MCKGDIVDSWMPSLSSTSELLFADTDRRALCTDCDACAAYDACDAAAADAVVVVAAIKLTVMVDVVRSMRVCVSL